MLVFGQHDDVVAIVSFSHMLDNQLEQCVETYKSTRKTRYIIGIP